MLIGKFKHECFLTWVRFSDVILSNTLSRLASGNHHRLFSMVPISQSLDRIIWKSFTTRKMVIAAWRGSWHFERFTYRQLRGPHSAALSLIFSTRSTNLPTRWRSATSNCSLRRMTSRMASRSAGSNAAAVGFPVLQPVRSLQLYQDRTK